MTGEPYYNVLVPTPFYHLSLGEDLLAQPALALPVRNFLLAYRPAFLLGNTAPDVQSISGQERDETHFYRLPIQSGDTPAWLRLLEVHPRFKRVSTLPYEQTAFLAGYLCHLLADWYWITDIFIPAFGPYCTWQDFPTRLYLHNVLRAYLDRQIYTHLPDDMCKILALADIHGWLPFVSDDHLLRWRNWLANQLSTGGMVETVEVFASRQGISPQEYYRLLNSEERLEEQIFSRLSRTVLEDYYQRMVGENLRLLHNYLGGA